MASERHRALFTIDLTGDGSPGPGHRVAPRPELASVVVSLDSDVSFERPATPAPVPRTKKPLKKKSSPAPSKETRQSRCGESPLGDCPICFEELGKRVLASTRCGHVFCMDCLERALAVERRCPACRRSLRSHAAYHPLFLGNR